MAQVWLRDPLAGLAVVGSNAPNQAEESRMLATVLNVAAAVFLILAGVVIVAGLILMGPLALGIIVPALIGFYGLRVYIRRERERGTDTFLDAYYHGRLDGTPPRGPAEARELGMFD